MSLGSKEGEVAMARISPVLGLMATIEPLPVTLPCSSWWASSCSSGSNVRTTLLPGCGPPVADHVGERRAQRIDAVVDGPLRGLTLHALGEHGLAVAGQDETARRGDAPLGLEPVFGVVGQRLPGVDLPVGEHGHEPEETGGEEVERAPDLGVHEDHHPSLLYASPSASLRPALSETSNRSPVRTKLPTTEEPP